MVNMLGRDSSLFAIRFVGTLCILAGITAPISQGAVMSDLLAGDSITCSGATF